LVVPSHQTAGRVVTAVRQENRLPGIANKIKLFNEAYKLAWDQLMQDSQLLSQPSGLAIRLRDNIQILIKQGGESAQFIAVEAIAKMKS
jgi:hypothetical protein